MTFNGTQPDEVWLRCMDMNGVIEYVGGSPYVFRRRCKNQQCCPRREGHMSVHRWCIDKAGCKDKAGNPFGVGEYVTEYVPDKTDVSEILALRST